MLVDSEQELPSLVDDAFNADFHLDLAFDGPAALIKIRGQMPDAVLVDVADPGVRGHELIRFLLDKDGTRDIPIIALGNAKVGPDVEKAIRSEENVRAYFRKPFIYKDLKPEIEVVLNGSATVTLASKTDLAAPKVSGLPEPAAVPPRKLSPWVRWPLMGMGAVVLLAALAEGAWRWMESRHHKQVFDPPILESRWGGIPFQFPVSASWEQGGREYALNGWGLRGPEINLIKSEDTYRILVLGGTDVFGEGVSQEEILTSRLQARLQESQLLMGVSRVEVLNGGFWGLTTEEQWSYYEKAVAQLRPDMVIWLWGTEGAVPYNGERLRLWSRLPQALKSLSSVSHILRTYRRRYWLGGAQPLPVNYPTLVKRARSFMDENGGILIIAAPVSIPINFPTEPEYHEVRQNYFFFGMGERPSSQDDGVWSAQNHESFAVMIEKYVLLAYPEGVRRR